MSQVDSIQKSTIKQPEFYSYMDSGCLTSIEIVDDYIEDLYAGPLVNI